MFTFRPTKRLARALKLQVPTIPPRIDNRLGDWCVNDFPWGDETYLMCCNTATLFPVICPAIGVRDEATLVARMTDALAGTVPKSGGNPSFARWLKAHGAGFQFAPVPDRAILAGITDLIFQARFAFEDHLSYTPAALSRHVAQTPLSVLGGQSPDRAFLRLATS